MNQLTKTDRNASVIHNFRDSLARSHAAADLPIWVQMYRRQWPHLSHVIDERQNGYHQVLGIDRRVVIPGRIRDIFIDEKARGRNRKTGKIYRDVALEFLSNDRTGAPGWVCKPMEADYIAYAIVPLGYGYLLPVDALQGAWRHFGEHWKRTYRIITAPNNGYNTLSVCLPWTALAPCLCLWHYLQFDATPFEE